MLCASVENMVNIEKDTTSTIVEPKISKNAEVFGAIDASTPIKAETLFGASLRAFFSAPCL
jgi:hypothetical protein